MCTIWRYCFYGFDIKKILRRKKRFITPEHSGDGEKHHETKLEMKNNSLYRLLIKREMLNLL